jgi:hypothetical protein
MANAKFVVIANYDLDDLEIDCFSQNPQVFIFTKNAGDINLKLESLKQCYHYSSIIKKEFFECDEKGLNRFVIDELKENVEHSFKIDSVRDCQKQKQDFIKSYFQSKGLPVVYSS